MIAVILTAALVAAPLVDDGAAAEAPKQGSGFSRFSEGGLGKKPEEEAKKSPMAIPPPKAAKTTTTANAPEGSVAKVEGSPVQEPATPAKAETKEEKKKRQKRELTTKKAVDAARNETIEMLDEVKSVLSGLERGLPVQPEVTVVPKAMPSGRQECDLELPQIIAFELQRIRVVRDEAEMMLQMHDENLKVVEQKIEELEKSRKQLDEARTALEETLSRKSLVDDDKEKERRRLRLLMSSRTMKPRKLAALMNELSLDEARVLLESLNEATSKAVLEALSPERLAKIMSEDKKSSTKRTSEPTTTAAKPKETL
jgi:hypothetical protein